VILLATQAAKMIDKVWKSMKIIFLGVLHIFRSFWDGEIWIKNKEIAEY
jgi:hypothetical protein